MSFTTLLLGGNLLLLRHAALSKSVLESGGDVLHVLHASGARGAAADRLVAPIVTANLGRRVRASGATALL